MIIDLHRISFPTMYNTTLFGQFNFRRSLVILPKTRPRKNLLSPIWPEDHVESLQLDPREPKNAQEQKSSKRWYLTPILPGLILDYHSERHLQLKFWMI